MRELDFVPPWYAAVQRRKRLLKLQLSVTVVVALSLATWGVVNAQSIEQGRAVLQTRQAELQVSSNRVHEREMQQKLREQLQTQERVESSLGLNVESSRLILLLDKAMPKVVSLTHLSIDTSERPRPRLLKDKKGPPPLPDRRMQVQLRGVAPTTADIAAVYENLTSAGVCDDLRLNYAKERVDGGHVVREFEMQFSVNLNAAEGADR